MNSLGVRLVRAEIYLLRCGWSLMDIIEVIALLAMLGFGGFIFWSL